MGAGAPGRMTGREGNGFTWGPIVEVAKLFAGIFITIIPAIAMLRAGTDGALAAIIRLLTTPDGSPVNYMYFWMTGLLSAFLDNLTTILLVVPITFLLADALDIDPIPLVIIEVIASNIGGTATLIGDPPNIIIAGATGLSFNAFIVNLAPIAVLALALVIPLLYLHYRSRLTVAEADRELTDEVMYEIVQLCGCYEYQDTYATKRAEDLPVDTAVMPTLMSSR